MTTAYWLSEPYDCSVVLLENERDIAQQTTLRNADITRSPLIPAPGEEEVLARSGGRSYELWKALAELFVALTAKVGRPLSREKASVMVRSFVDSPTWRKLTCNHLTVCRAAANSDSTSAPFWGRLDCRDDEGRRR